MTKRQIEVLEKAAKSEEEILQELKKNYAIALRQIEEKIAYLMVQEQTPSKIYQLKYQQALKKQVSDILDLLNNKNYASIQEYLKNCYEDAFIGVIYDLYGQGIPVTVPINQEEVLNMVMTSPDDIKLSTRLYKHIDKMKEDIVTTVSASILNGDSWEMIARRLADCSDVSYNRTLTIARTEGHRVQQASSYDAQCKAREKGADIVKQWDSTLDGATRPHHVELDGQIREVDEPFEVAGMKAMYPGAFGDPAEDCNCRCCLLQRARWAVEMDTTYTKYNGDTKEYEELSDAENFEEFKKQYEKIDMN